MKMYSTNLTDNQWQVIEKNHKRASGSSRVRART